MFINAITFHGEDAEIGRTALQLQRRFRVSGQDAVNAKSPRRTPAGSNFPLLTRVHRAQRCRNLPAQAVLDNVHPHALSTMVSEGLIITEGWHTCRPLHCTHQEYKDRIAAGVPMKRPHKCTKCGDKQCYLCKGCCRRLIQEPSACERCNRQLRRSGTSTLSLPN